MTMCVSRRDRAVSFALDTNVSRLRHRRAIFHDTRGRLTGYIYVCPRCEWESSVMRHFVGAMRHGDEHALVCQAVRQEAAG